MARGDPNFFNDETVRLDFLAALAGGASVLKACAMTRQVQSAAYLARRCIAGFAEAWDARVPPRPAWRKPPVRGPRNRWDLVFLDHFRDSANVVQAAKAAGVTRQTVYRQRTIDRAFNIAWIEARDEASDLIEGHLLSQCIHGFKSVVIKDGVETHINDPCPEIVLAVLDRYYLGKRTQRRGPQGRVASVPSAPRWRDRDRMGRADGLSLNI